MEKNDRLISVEGFKREFHVSTKPENMEIALLEGRVFIDMNVVNRALENAPAVDTVVHSRWDVELDDMGWNKHTCLNCGYVKRTDIHVSLGWDYCPKCGAKMDVKED